MDIKDLLSELKLEGKALGITRVCGVTADGASGGGCSLKELKRAFSGETVVLNVQSLSCSGAPNGFGFRDGLPQIAGGFGKFITTGAGKGFPPGERIKCSEAVAEQMIINQPQNVMEGYDAIKIAPLADDNEREGNEKAELAAFLVNPDQLSALVHLYNYRSSEYDRVIMPMASGCATIFRIPFGEMISGRNRAVIGNADVFSRPHFPDDTLFFIISGKSLREILEDADESFLRAPIWNLVKRRLHKL